jgi:RNA polymerase sigma factor (sigma-70 family)
LSPLALSLRFLQTQSDAQLTALARAGHERAFEALVRRYRQQLLAYCRRIGSPGTNAEDTLQQALLQAWTAIRTGVEVRDPRAWLYRIVHNVAITNQRRPALIPVELRDTPGTNGADDEAEQRMAARDALAGLAALPDLQREVMVGTAVDGLSHEQLATALGLTSGAVRGLIYRARATLRAAAAAILPGPVISWSLRSGTGHSTGLYEALGGGGSAGIGGLLIKGGAIAATAGAIATATGISTSHKAVHHRATTTAATGEHPLVHAQPTASTARSTRLLVVDPTRSHTVSPGGAGQRGRHSGSSARGAQSSGHRSADNGFLALSGEPSSGEGHHRRGSGGSSDGGDHGGSSGGGGRPSGHDGSGGGSSSGHDGSSSGHDGSGSGSGSDGSHSGSAPATLSGGSGGDHGGALSGGDGGGSGGGGDSVSTDGSTATTPTSGDGSGDSGSSTTTTATPTTVPTTPTVTAPGDDGSDSGHGGGK